MYAYFVALSANIHRSYMYNMYECTHVNHFNNYPGKKNKNTKKYNIAEKAYSCMIRG